MATLNFSYETGTVPLQRIVDGMANKFGYRDTIPDPAHPGEYIPNPETKQQFGRSVVKRFIINAVLDSERTVVTPAPLDLT